MIPTLEASQERTPTKANNSIVYDSAIKELSPYNSSTLIQAITTKSETNAKLRAAEMANSELKEKLKSLEDELEGINLKSDEALSILEEQRDALSEENERLRRELISLPSLEWMIKEREELSKYPLLKVKEQKPKSISPEERATIERRIKLLKNMIEKTTATSHVRIKELEEEINKFII